MAFLNMYRGEWEDVDRNDLVEVSEERDDEDGRLPVSVAELGAWLLLVLRNEKNDRWLPSRAAEGLLGCCCEEDEIGVGGGRLVGESGIAELDRLGEDVELEAVAVKVGRGIDRGDVGEAGGVGAISSRSSSSENLLPLIATLTSRARIQCCSRVQPALSGK